MGKDRTIQTQIIFLENKSFLKLKDIEAEFENDIDLKST